MRVFAALLLWTALAGGCRPAPATNSPHPEPQRSRTEAAAIIAEVDRLAGVELWPGFDPAAVPVAIYDGENTLLFRHPAPPAGFHGSPEHPGVLRYAGRHPSVAANTSIELNGVRTATLMPGAEGVALRRRVGLLIHEAFHVFQREHHPGWSANEAELFSYPVADAALLALRREESEALRRALAAASPEGTACWARLALDVRYGRFAALAPGAAEYERKTELNEGLASYVEYRALAAPDSAVLPGADFPPEAVRQRAYASGAAIARLLDRLAPAWRQELTLNDSVPLDGLLDTALRARPGAGASCALPAPQRASIRAVASADVEALEERRAELRRDFLGRQGWRLVVVASGTPLFPQGFDPLNVHLLGVGEVLHTRFLELGNAAGTLEVLGRDALTEAAGPHPLFNGVRTLTITGLEREPAVADGAESVVLDADGVRGELRGAAVERDGITITIRLAVP
jgi:hypothetical protein